MITLGLVEKININGKEFLAKIDTGADSSCIDLKSASRLNLGPIVGFRRIKSAHGKSIRPTVKALIRLKGRAIRAELSVVSRSKLKYKVLLGKRTLKKLGFLIDPRK